MRVALGIEYDGRAYSGWESQRGVPTVQGTVEAALSKVADGPLRIVCAGRTDAGVHAEGQAVNFLTSSCLPLENIRRGLNTYLPNQISVLDVETVPRVFHAQHSAKRKIYEYHVWNSRVRSPLLMNRAFHFPYPVSLTKMKKGAKLFLGSHDFRAFEASGSRRKSGVRTIYRCGVRVSGQHLYFTVESNGFLYRMVRNMVGALLEIGTGRLTLTQLELMVTKQVRKVEILSVPPQGLTLKRVIYARNNLLVSK